MATGRASGCGSSATRSRSRAAIFIIFLILVAFIGAPIVKKLLGHGPNDLFPYPGTGGIDNNLLPKGPMSYVQDPINGTKQLFILGVRRVARPRRVPPDPLRRPGLDRGRVRSDLPEHVPRRDHGLARRLLRRLDGHADLARHRDHDVLPVPALRDRGREHGRQPHRQRHLRLPRAGRPHADPRLRLLKLVLRRACVQRDRPVAAREGVRRGGADGRLEQPAHRPLARAAAPRRADHRARRRSTSRRSSSPRRASRSWASGSSFRPRAGGTCSPPRPTTTRPIRF